MRALTALVALLLFGGCASHYIAGRWVLPDGSQVVALQDNLDEEATLDLGAELEAACGGYTRVELIRERWFPDVFLGRWGCVDATGPLRLTRWYRLSSRGPQ